MGNLSKKIISLQYKVPNIAYIFWMTIFIFLFLVSSLLFLTSHRVETKPIGWLQSRLLSTPGIRIKKSSYASAGSVATFVYQGSQGKSSNIYLSISLNGGLSFLSSKKIIEISGEQNSSPTIAVSNNGKISIVWQSFSNKDYSNRIYIKESIDFGANWSENKQLHFGNKIEMLPKIYYDDTGLLHIFFHGFNGSIFRLYHSIYENNKIVSTKSLMDITRGMKGAFFPAIRFNGKSIFFVWQEKAKSQNKLRDKLYFIKSNNYGKDWSSKRMISFGSSSDSNPSVFINKGDIYVAYENNDNNSWSIKLIKGENMGARWGEPLQISTTNANCYSPKLFSNGQELGVVWYDLRDGVEHIYYREYNYVTKKFKKEVRLSERRAAAFNPNIIIYKNDISVVWSESGRLYQKALDRYVAPVKVYSSTHPAYRWSRNSNAVLKWIKPKDPSDIVGYASIVNKLPYFNPVLKNIGANISRTTIGNISDGITYFHIRAIDGAGNYGRTVHYKLMVSANPLPLPVVVSTTHPEGKLSKLNRVQFKWAIDSMERLKGFVYSLSKDKPQKPTIFTEDFSRSFSIDASGKYSFNIGAIDQTGQLSQIVHYQFAVGNMGGKDFSLPDSSIDKYKKKKYIKPNLKLNLPILRGSTFKGDKITGIIEALNINKKQIRGYSVKVSKEKQNPLYIISQSNNIFNYNFKEDGSYWISIILKYVRNGTIQWTRPLYQKINVEIPYISSPIIEVYDNIKSLILNKKIVVLPILGIMFLILINIFLSSGRLVFYIKLFSFKMKIMLGIL